VKPVEKSEQCKPSGAMPLPARPAKPGRSRVRGEGHEPAPHAHPSLGDNLQTACEHGTHRIPPGEALARRGFFRAIARAAAGGALAGLGVVLAFSGRGPAKEDPCLRMGVCRGCDRAEDCGLPQALSIRQALADGLLPSAAESSREAAKGGQTGV